MPPPGSRPGVPESTSTPIGSGSYPPPAGVDPDASQGTLWKLALTDRLAHLERHWERSGLARPAGLEPVPPAGLAELARWVAPLAIAGELAELYQWYGGGGDLILPRGGQHGQLLAPDTAIEHTLAFYADELALPWPRNLVPVLAGSAAALGVVEIQPGRETCRVWHYSREDGAFELFYPSAGDLVAAIEALTPFTEPMAERGDDVLAHHVAAARHPELFDPAPSYGTPPRAGPRALTTCDLSDRAPTGPEARFLAPWPDHWLPGGAA